MTNQDAGQREQAHTPVEIGTIASPLSRTDAVLLAAGAGRELTSIASLLLDVDAASRRENKRKLEAAEKLAEALRAIKDDAENVWCDPRARLDQVVEQVDAALALWEGRE